MSPFSGHVAMANLILLALLLVGSVGAYPTCNFPALFNFGDSNSDTGGLSAAFGQAPHPNGESFFGGPAGRYCDGRLVVDFIAEHIGLPYINAYLDSLGTNFSHGANFATAGSTVRPQNTTKDQSGFSPFPLNVQSWQFSQFVNRTRAIYEKGGVFAGLMPRPEVFSQALYAFDIGQNDLTAGLFLNQSIDEVKANIPDILGQFVTVVKTVHWLGGRSFWIHNTGPFGCLAYVLDRLPILAPQVDRVGCVSPFNELAQFFNQKLNETVSQFRKDMPDATFTYVDVYSVKFELIHQARKYGFGNPLRACCGHGGKYNFNQNVGCGGTKFINGTYVVVGKSCEDPERHVNWDGVHYTQAANKFVFDNIVNGGFSDTSLPLQSACGGPLKDKHVP